MAEGNEDGVASGGEVTPAASSVDSSTIGIVVAVIIGIIVVGGLLQAGSGNLNAAAVLGTIAILVASINIAGGFLVTQRMLAMFRK